MLRPKLYGRVTHVSTSINKREEYCRISRVIVKLSSKAGE